MLCSLPLAWWVKSFVGTLQVVSPLGDAVESGTLTKLLEPVSHAAEASCTSLPILCQQSPLVVFIQTSNFATPKPSTGSVISGEVLWPRKAGTENPAARTFTAAVLASLENQAEGDTEGFQQGKDVTQAGL